MILLLGRDDDDVDFLGCAAAPGGSRAFPHSRLRQAPGLAKFPGDRLAAQGMIPWGSGVRHSAGRLVLRVIRMAPSKQKYLFRSRRTAHILVCNHRPLRVARVPKSVRAFASGTFD